MTKKILLLMMILSINTTFALNTRYAIFSGAMGEEFKKLDGVIDVYYGVAYGDIHREVVQIKYNEDIISYRQLLNAFFRMIDPTDMFGSFENRNVVYSPAIYTSDEEQNQLANLLIQKIQESKHFTKPIVVRVISEFIFVMSENKLQNSIQHEFYKGVSARSSYIRKVWDKIPQELLLVDNYEDKFFVAMEMRDKYKDFVKPSRKQLRDNLTEMQFAVTQLGATEPPFWEQNLSTNNTSKNSSKKDTKKSSKEVINTNKIINDDNINKRGIYVDVVSGEPLFSSIDRVDLNTGWPNFRRPIAHDFVVEREDFSLFYKRIEIRSRYADSHIGYIVDGYYQVNISALRFIPYDQMDDEGYGEYIDL